MSDGIYVALSGALAQSMLLESTANNLANTATDGYQRTRPVFQETLAAVGGAASRRTPGVTVTANALDQTQGALRVTGRQLDAALPDGVYLAVSTTRGERYTRAVSLTVGNDGTVRTGHGDAVAREDGRPLVIPPGIGDPSRTGDLGLTVNGTTTQSGPITGIGEVGLTTDGELMRGGISLGRMRLVRFDRPQVLTQEAGALMVPNGAVATVATNTPINVGAVEESNATTVSAMTDMVTATRTFEAFQRVIEAFREADRRVVSSVLG